MSYRVKIRQMPDITVADERGQALMAAKLAVNPPKDVNIDGNLYPLTWIGPIVHVGGNEHVPLHERQQTNLLAGEKKCRGQYSIQNEINTMIKTDYPDEWGILISDAGTRETLYKQLRAQKGVMWCDYKTKECHCE